jgi:hypothetical protein
MSEEPELEIETVYADGEMALATYASHTAELAQAFGNLLSQAQRMPVNHPLMSITLVMLEKVAGSVETKAKGSLKAFAKD